MEYYKHIQDRIRANAELIDAKTERVNALEFNQEKRAAANNHEIELFKELRARAEKNAPEIAALTSEIDGLKIVNKILLENARASFAEYASGIILKEFRVYAGKRYGEKTAEKIRAAVKSHGLTYYIDGGYIYASPLNSEGYITYSPIDRTEFYAVNQDGKSYDGDTPVRFITPSNVINGDALPRWNYRYTDDVPARVDAIKTAFEHYKQYLLIAHQAQTELNNLLPGTMPNFHGVATTGDYTTLI